MGFKTIKEMEALFKYVSSNIYYTYVRTSSILEYIGICSDPQSCWDSGKNCYILVLLFNFFYHLKGNYWFLIFLRESVENW